MPALDMADAADLLIVGGGTAGLTAAIAAAEAGGRAVVLESADQLGGTLFLAAGQMSAAGTRLQRTLGIADTAEEHIRRHHADLEPNRRPDGGRARRPSRSGPI